MNKTGWCLSILGLIMFMVLGCGLPRQRIFPGSKVTTIGTVNLDEDAIWEGEILVKGVVTIPSGVTLTVQPGTIIRFETVREKTYGSGNGIIVNGTLVARGTQSAKIIFTSAAEDPQRGDWNDIFFIVSEGEENILDHCIIRYANIGVHGHFCKLTVRNSYFSDNWRAFQFQESEMIIENNQFQDNHYGLRFRDSDVVLSGNQVANSFSGIETFRSRVKFDNNQVRNCYFTSVKFRESDVSFTASLIENSRRGLQVNDSTEVTITDSIFLNNYESGIFLKKSLVHLKRNIIAGNGGDGISVRESGLNANFNNIFNNGKFALDNEGKTPINAQNNWWGSTDILTIAEQIYDFFDSEESGKVDFALFLSEPIIQITNSIEQEPQ